MILRPILSSFAVASVTFLPLVPLTAQSPDSAPAPRARYTGFLPQAAFRPLAADPNEPRIGAAIRSGDFTRRGSIDGIASFGASLPIAGLDRGPVIVQIGAAGGAIARFDMKTPANDIVSEDYEVGIPVWIKAGSFAARVRVYHRSSHIGDEFVLNNPDFTRIDLTYEAVETILSISLGDARLYAGGDYIYDNVTTDIDPGVFRSGADIVTGSRMLGRSVTARLVGGIDLKAANDLEWTVAKSAVAGVELSRIDSRSPTMRILIELFSGPSEAGQFYRRSERYVGIGAYVTP
jgi:hypothetical protein